jgi:hypothetical protein
MPFRHEKLTVYQRALEFASWSQDLINSAEYAERADEEEEVEED